MWGNYWSERELCIVAGDTGVGKTVLALHIAKALAGGCVVGVEDNVGRPRKVLYVDFELDREGFYLRYGNDDTLEHLYWAGYNQSGSMPGHVDNACEWMLDSIKAYIKEYGIEAVIIDQPDRLRLSPKQWQDFCLLLNA
ncbi:MAG: AAA family ATPase [Sphingobacteriales bacterium JAD_PAG50586_3]|nr:MAG: AAA family ATPase [Sphingobacteriales bacterium JAD_PAG50586_3]